MNNRTINDYYEALQYDEVDETKTVAKLCQISNEIVFETDDNFSKRFFETATVIEKNLPLFQSLCEHVDNVITIIEYLKYYGMVFINNKLDKLEEEEEVIKVLSTLFNTCISNQNNVQLFLSKSLLQNSNLEGYEQKIYNQILCQYNEVIILEDADVYAVINGIKPFFFNKIWIQESIISKVWPFIERSFGHFTHIFRSKQNLLESIAPNALSIISIWSEDIIAAKDLATSLNRDVIFINTFMDIYGGIVLLPYTKKLETPTLLENECASTLVKPNIFEYMNYNLFYDGMWQKPMKNTYWLNKDILWANATNQDIKKCIDSAEKGAKLWSAKSINSRLQLLSKLASTLECNNKFQLADIISNWTKSLYLYENSVTIQQYLSSRRLEIAVMRKPRGIVALKSKNLDFLFWQLTLALITGNSVIVLCNSEYCSLAPYCDMFSTTGIPPGVVNVLSIETLENVLQEYYIDEIDLDSKEKKEYYIKFTKPKTVILPVK